MPKGELYIKTRDDGTAYDAYETWGVSLEQTGLSALMTPPPLKDVIESKYRSLAGKRVIADAPLYDERDITLPLHITAKDADEFFARYTAFCTDVLAKGRFTLWVRYQPDIVYRVLYVSCSQFSEFVTSYASFSLKLNEPDPANRDPETDTSVDNEYDDTEGYV
ncbi:MAG: phage tail family protein [Prevotella sp.]|nr:phage tail family protein [Prevotella sp.]